VCRAYLSVVVHRVRVGEQPALTTSSNKPCAGAGVLTLALRHNPSNVSAVKASTCDTKGNNQTWPQATARHQASHESTTPSPLLEEVWMIAVCSCCQCSEPRQRCTCCSCVAASACTLACSSCCNGRLPQSWCICQAVGLFVAYLPGQ
jgi:hypothetical protein